MTMYTIHTDGGARGNPGPAAIGVVIETNDQSVTRFSQYIGETTNNQAEYRAVHAALRWVVDHGPAEVDLYADSELIVKQLRREYKMKNADLAPWWMQIHQLVNQIGRVRFHHIRREANAAADALVNEELDQQARGV
ncbi:MAG: ribonuclease HI family protein [Candidatus Kerfeldbacteria bacterium]|nr:ribonuclease HI family protein [Candidatus Kerfeldbacteria bacterium]